MPGEGKAAYAPNDFNSRFGIGDLKFESDLPYLDRGRLTMNDEHANQESPDSPRERPLGELLVEEAAVTREQLDRALRIQSKLKTKKRVGRILIELGFLTEDGLEAVMHKYARRIRFGDLLVEREYVTPEELDTALALQKENPSLKLGQVLVRERIITETSLCEALALYLKMERGTADFRKLDWNLVKKVSLSFLEQNRALPFQKRDDGVVVLVTENYSRNAKPVLEGIFSEPLIFALVTEGELNNMFQYLKEKPKTDNVRQLKVDMRAGTVSALLDQVVAEAIEAGASDIHIEPMDSLGRIRFRIDGSLVQMHTYAIDQNAALMARIKVLSDCDIAERRNHQDGKFQVAFKGHPIDLRVSIFVTVHGESAVIRILNPFSSLLGLDSLGLSRKNLERYEDELISPATGIVLVTGPTGSGKTTTLYGTLQYQLEEGEKIVTVEDPVEYIIPEIVQCSVDERSGRTFSTSLKAIMRQDPDIIVLGEIRDLESAAIAIQASMTGHKVYATFHTEDATGALVRLIQMGVERYLVASTVLGVVGQRLVRRICSHCKEPRVPQVRYLRRLGLSPKILSSREFFYGRGCKHCYSTGYSGRVPIQEILIMEDRIRDAVLRDAGSYQIRKLAVEHAGLVTMAEDGVYKVGNNLTTFDEIVHQVPISGPVRPMSQIVELME